MGYPAAPTEAGSDKFHFLVSDGNAAFGFVAVETANPGTGSANAVGWMGIATHVEGDELVDPGDISTSAAPLVLIGGDNGTTVVPLQIDESAYLKVVLQAAGTTPVTNAGTFVVQIDGAALTALQLLDDAISGAEMQVDVVAALPSGSNTIGEVTIGTATSAATDLGSAIDSVAGAADVGVASLVVRDDALTTLTPVDGDFTYLRVSSTGALHVTGGGGGTQFNVDGALGATPEGTLTLAKRDDTLGGLTPAEGDAVELRVDANGALWTHDDVLDVALAGSELQVDIVASLPAGTNAIGKLAPNTGVDIGDVDVTSIVPGTGATSLGKAIQSAQGATDSGVAALVVRNDTLADLSGLDGDYTPLQVDADGALYVTIRDGGNSITIDGTITAANTAGNVAHDGADSGNPVKFGGRAQSPMAQPDEVADEDRVDALFDRNGYQRIRGDFNPLSADINDALSGDNTIIAAAGAGKKIAVWAILIVADGTTDVRWEDGAAGTAFTGQVPLQAREGYSISAGGLVPLFTGSAATLLNLELTAAVAVHGFISYTVIDD